MIQDYFKDTAVVQKCTRSDDGNGGWTESWDPDTSIGDSGVIKGLLSDVSSNDKYEYSKMGIDASYTFYTGIYNILSSHRIIYNGITFKILGKPKNPMNQNDHLKIPLKEIE
jgi:hypothetical protein